MDSTCMQLCYCFTNLKSCDVPAGFEDRLSAIVSDVLDKPPQRTTVILQTDLRISKGGSSAPAFNIQIHAIDAFDEQKCYWYFPKMFNFLEEELKLPADRFTIEFADLPGYMALQGIVGSPCWCTLQ